MFAPSNVWSDGCMYNKIFERKERKNNFFSFVLWHGFPHFFFNFHGQKASVFFVEWTLMAFVCAHSLCMQNNELEMQQQLRLFCSMREMLKQQHQHY